MKDQNKVVIFIYERDGKGEDSNMRKGSSNLIRLKMCILRL